MVIGICVVCGVEDFVHETDRGLVCWDCISPEEGNEIMDNQADIERRAKEQQRLIDDGYYATYEPSGDSFAWDTDEEAEEHAGDDYAEEQRILAENEREDENIRALATNYGMTIEEAAATWNGLSPEAKERESMVTLSGRFEEPQNECATCHQPVSGPIWGPAMCASCVAELEANEEAARRCAEYLESHPGKATVKCDVCGVSTTDAVIVGLAGFCEEHYQAYRQAYQTQKAAYVGEEPYPEFDVWCEEELGWAPSARFLPSGSDEDDPDYWGDPNDAGHSVSF